MAYDYGSSRQRMYALLREIDESIEKEKEMKKFKLSSIVTVSSYTTVEAETLEEAIAIAEDRDVVIGGLNSGMFEDEFWIIDDADGLPVDIKLADTQEE